MGIIIFNGVSSADYGIQVEHPPGYQTPAKDYEKIHVPGRNGDIVLDKGSYENVKRKYEIAIGNRNNTFAELANKISEWLNTVSGYGRLEDSYEPEYYRLALYDEETEIENIQNHAGRTTISFNCKPQRFLKSGDEPVFFSSKGLLINPTGFVALPIITVHGSGSGDFSIGDYTVSVSDINESTVINSELLDCYSGSHNRNSYVTFHNGFPKLIPGDSEVSFTGGITSVEVIPKWWTL